MTVNDRVENDWITNSSGFADPDRLALWIGLTDETEEGTWIWTNGESSPYRNWATGEPNNSSNEDYGELVLKTFQFLLPGSWNDGTGRLIRSGIVERDTQPPPDLGADLGSEEYVEEEDDFFDGEDVDVVCDCGE